MTVSNPARDPARVKEDEAEQRRRTGQKPAKGEQEPEPTPAPTPPPVTSVPGHEQGGAR